MKFSTCMAVLAFAVSLATTGCRYDQPEADSVDALTGADSSAGIDIGSDVADTDVAVTDADSGSLADLARGGEGLSNWEKLGYTRCADVDFAPVYFGFDATTIAPAELSKIEAVAGHLAENPDRVVTIEGNCDERGSNEYNLSLGDDRAIIIANFLAQNGVSRSRMETLSRGETNPAVEGSGEAAWSQNRRGEFVIWKK